MYFLIFLNTEVRKPSMSHRRERVLRRLSNSLARCRKAEESRHCNHVAECKS